MFKFMFRMMFLFSINFVYANEQEERFRLLCQENEVIQNVLYGRLSRVSKPVVDKFSFGRWYKWNQERHLGTCRFVFETQGEYDCYRNIYISVHDLIIIDDKEECDVYDY